MRLDSYVFEKGFAQSRNKAAELIKEGSVWLNGKVERKSSVEIGESDTVEVEKIMQYVSRAGLKLRGFINELGLHVKGFDVLDIGSSTGGFVQVWLEEDVKSVTAVDVGSEQLHPSLKVDSRIILHENSDIRLFKPERTYDMVSCDVSFIGIASLFIVTFYIVRFISSSIMFTLTYFITKQERGEEKARQLRGMTVLINIFVWIIGIVFLMDNLGFDISAVIAGLGIGGIAIALAAQAILGDLFSYFVIFFDRPFEVGDYITVQDKAGTVEYTGIKTTRIRALTGEQLVFSNTDLTNSRIHNFKKMQERRVLFKLSVIYQTPASTLEEIPKIVRGIIEKHSDVRFDRGHFASYGEFSLNFEFVYFVLEADYIKYMDIHQAINLEIYKEFEKRGISFAYPTQTLYLNKEEKTQN